MKGSVKNLKDCKVRMTVEIEAKLVEDRYQRVLRDFQRAAQLPGFREGKAPLDLVEKKYAKEAQEEVLKTLIPEAYHWQVAEKKLSPVTLPAISEIKLERGKRLTFAAEFEKSPEFPVRGYKGIRIRRTSAEVPAGELERAMNSLVESRAEFVAIAGEREARQGDFILADVELWQEGAYQPARKNVLLYLEPNPSDDFFDKVVGTRPGEVREVSLKDGKPLYKVVLKAVQEKRLPALDEAFAKLFGRSTVDDLREALHRDVAAHRQAEAREAMKAELFKKLLDMARFEIPEGLVTRQKERLLEQARRRGPALPADAEKEAEAKAREQVKLYFVLQKIAEAEEIVADETEVGQRLAALAEEAKRPLDEVRHVFEEDVRESLREARTIDFLLANAKLEEKQ